MQNGSYRRLTSEELKRIADFIRLVETIDVKNQRCKNTRALYDENICEE